jgi:hypothetical protein
MPEDWPAAPRVPATLDASAEALQHDAWLVEVRLADVAAHGLVARGLELERMRMHGCELDGAQLARPSLRDVELERCSRAGALEWAEIVGLAGTLAAALGLRVLDEG